MSCELHRLEGVPRPAPTDHLGLEQADHCLGKGVVIGIADAADRGFDACFGKPLGVADRDILAAAIAVMHEPVSIKWTPLVERLFERIEYKAGVG